MSTQTLEHPSYIVNIEGVEHAWPRNTITTEEVIALGGWDPSLGAILIDKDNNERTLKPGEVVEVKRGQGFAKKVRFRRGSADSDRIRREIELLKGQYPDLEHLDDWVRLPLHPIPPGWSRPATDVAFPVPTGYPGTPPYGIYVPAGLLFNGTRPNNYVEPASNHPPFSGTWGVLSWTPFDGQWRPTADILSGSHLGDFVRTFADRFREGI